MSITFAHCCPLFRPYYYFSDQGRFSCVFRSCLAGWAVFCPVLPESCKRLAHLMQCESSAIMHDWVYWGVGQLVTERCHINWLITGQLLTIISSVYLMFLGCILKCSFSAALYRCSVCVCVSTVDTRQTASRCSESTGSRNSVVFFLMWFLYC